jgi:hypothetical protein
MHLATVDTVSRPEASGYQARLGELLLRLNISTSTPLDIGAGKSQEEQERRLVATERTAEEVSNEPGKRFALGDISGGEGLFFAHRQNAAPSDARRFWDSEGIDNQHVRPGELAGFRLLQDTKSVFTADVPGPTNPYLVVLADGAVIYAFESTVRRVGSPHSGAFRVTEDPHTGSQPVTGLAVLGSEVFAACGTDGIGKRSAGGTWSDLGALSPVTGIWAAKKRLLAALGTTFSEIDTTAGTGTTLLTLPVGTTVTSVADAGTAILVAASDGRLYSFIEEGGALELAGQTSFPGEEWPTVVAAALGKVLVGTAERTTAGGRHGRLYVASLGDANTDFALVEMQILRDFASGSAAIDHSPTVATTRRDEILIGVRGVGVAQLWRYQLVTGGLNRDLSFPVEDQFYGLGVVGGSVIAGIANDGLRIEDMDNKVPTGYVISALADHFTAVEKTWAQAVLEAAEIDESDGNVQVYVTTNPHALNDPDHASWLLLGTMFTDALGTRLPIFGLATRYIAIKAVINASPGRELSPIVSSVVITGYPRSEEIRIRLPVNVSDRVERANRRPIYVKGLGERLLQELLAREGAPTELELYRPGLILSGTVESIEHRGVGMGKRSAGTLTAYVNFLGRRNVAFAAPSGLGAAGMGMFGIIKFGG